MIPFAPPTTEPAAMRAYRALEKMIVTLELPPRTVTTEGALIDVLKLGRTPVREAIQRLSWEGLVEVRPRAGLAIAPLNASDWLKVLDARRGLEVTLAKSAARFVTADLAAQFRHAALRMQKATVAGNAMAFLEADREVDEAMALASDNPHAARAAAPLQTHSRRFWYRFQADSGLAPAAEQHIHVIQAILDGDEREAAKAADQLVTLLRRNAEAAARI